MHCLDNDEDNGETEENEADDEVEDEEAREKIMLIISIDLNTFLVLMTSYNPYFAPDRAALTQI